MEKNIRVLVVDDSPTMCRLLKSILTSDPGIEVIGTAPDPYAARERIKALNPDVLTLDVEMPLMDGLAFLRNLMRLRPMPVVMCSTLTQQGAAVALDALAIGAVDFVGKPASSGAHNLDSFAQELIAKVKTAVHARVRTLPDALAPGGRTRPKGGRILPARGVWPHSALTNRIIAIGASTGGTEAIKQVLMDLPGEMPGIVIAQHIPKAFSGKFARRMDEASLLEVCEAEDGQPILPGHAYIAPGDQHLIVVRDGEGYRCRLSDGEPVNRHRPSVDVLFRSVARSAGPHSIGVILTGMGRDGAEGLKEMLDEGAATVGQDENTSVVWGMPGAAWHVGAVEALHPLPEIAERIMELVAASVDPLRHAAKKPSRTMAG